MKIIIRGGGDLGSGIALRLHHIGWKIIICEIDNPLTLRRSVAFANAVYEKDVFVEDVQGKIINNVDDISNYISANIIPVIIDPELTITSFFKPDIIIDARMLKIDVDYDLEREYKVIGLGPGFKVGKNCHAVIETNRGHYLGRVIWSGEPEENTGSPGIVKEFDIERVLRSPADGIIFSKAKIGEIYSKGETIGTVGGQPIVAPFNGCLRGLMHNGIMVTTGLKIGDLDPRMDSKLISFVSDKALAVSGGVIEAILILINQDVKHN